MTAKHRKDHEAEPERRSSDAADKRIAELEEQVGTLTAEKQDLFEKLQRISADYINYQNRAPRQIAESVAYEKKAIVRSIIPTLDNLAHAVASAAESRGSGADDSVVKGIQLVIDHMLDALKSLGVERIVARGNDFDPSLHEAIMQRTEEDQPDNVVLEEFQNGYTLNGQVIRPAKVVVNKLPESPAEDQPDEQTPADDAEGHAG
ncbi:MAG: nucleotide exchange factor GrpE [Phycisphaerae bacterium]|nr:nucleotide exchange factor GrpE [Phycisphaerae bacterium]